MKLEFELSKESIDKIAAKVAVINQEKAPKREIIIPSKEDFQYTVSEVSKMTKQSEGTITRHIRDELLVASKIGKSWKITQENYLNYINNKSSNHD